MFSVDLLGNATWSLAFLHISNAVDDVCLACCRKGLMATNSTMKSPFQTYLHLHFYPKRSFAIRGSITCQKYLHLYYKLKRRTPRTFCIKSHPDLVLKDQYKIIFQFNSNLDLRPNLNDGTIGFWFWDFTMGNRLKMILKYMSFKICP